LIPSAIAEADRGSAAAVTQKLSLGLAVLLILGYGLGLLFSLRTHREIFASANHADEDEAPWPIGLALATLAGVTLVVALVSEIFVESVQKAAESFGMSAAFVGFIVVALVGGAAEMVAAFSGAPARTGLTSAWASRSGALRKSPCSSRPCRCCRVT
jgi:Ca2+:H+ antiporter